MLGGNQGSLLYGDVSVMYSTLGPGIYLNVFINVCCPKRGSENPLVINLNSSPNGNLFCHFVVSLKQYLRLFDK